MKFKSSDWVSLSLGVGAWLLLPVTMLATRLADSLPILVAILGSPLVIPSAMAVAAVVFGLLAVRQAHAPVGIWGAALGGAFLGFWISAFALILPPLILPQAGQGVTIVSTLAILAAVSLAALAGWIWFVLAVRRRSHAHLIASRLPPPDAATRLPTPGS